MVDRRQVGPLTLEVEGDQVSLHLAGQQSSSLTLRGGELDELLEALDQAVNFVPVTMMVTALIDSGDVSIPRLHELAAQCRGTVHFRPMNNATHAVASHVVGELLGLE